MSASYRLSRQDFSRLKVARRQSGTFFTLSIGVVHGRSIHGFASVVSKKAARRAVDRNRIKRRIRDVMRTLLPALPNGMAMVVYAKNGVIKASMEDTRNDIEKLFTRLLPPGGRK